MLSAFNYDNNANSWKNTADETAAKKWLTPTSLADSNKNIEHIAQRTYIFLQKWLFSNIFVDPFH